jgi:hypothetical protein
MPAPAPKYLWQASNKSSGNRHITIGWSSGIILNMISGSFTILFLASV